MNSKYLIFLGLICCSFLGGCKTSHHDTVINFRTYFKPIDDSSFVYCFDHIYAIGKSDLTGCVDSINNFIDLPLDINADVSVFVFQKDSISDTLSIKYKRKIVSDDKDVQMEVTEVQLKNITFDSVGINCKDKKSICNDIESITIYY